MDNQDIAIYAIEALKNDSRFSDVDMTPESAFYNLNILPFTILCKPVNDLKNYILNSYDLDTMTEDQLDTHLANMFVTRSGNSSSIVEVLIYLKNTADIVEPLTTFTTDEYRTDDNKVFYPIRDYVIAYGTLPVDASGNYRIASIMAINTNTTTAIAKGTIKNTTFSHPQFDHVTNISSSSIPKSKESNADYIKTAKAALSVRNNSNRLSITTNLKNDFPSIIDLSVITSNSPEMQRDIAVAAKNWSGHFGGMCDIYLKTPLVKKTFTCVGTKNSTNTGYFITLQKYQGVDIGNSSIIPTAPWSLISGSVPDLPLLYLDMANTSVTGTTITDYSIDILPEKTYGKNYRFSQYESIKLNFITSDVSTDTKNVTISYYTLGDIESIQSYIGSDDDSCTNSNNLVKSFIPVVIDELYIKYDSNYTINESVTIQAIADKINNWTLNEPIKFGTLFKELSCPVFVSEQWDTGKIPWNTGANGIVTTSNSNTPSTTYGKMTIHRIDGTRSSYISTSKLYPLEQSIGLSQSFKTCRYFIDTTNIHLIKGEI